MLVLLAALFLTPLLQRGLPFAPSTLRRTSGRATMTIAGVAGTPYVAVGEHARARRTGFSHRVGAPTVRGCGLFVFSNGIPIDIKSVRALVVRPCLSPERETGTALNVTSAQCIRPRARLIGFSHRVGAFYSSWLRPFALPRPDPAN
jgi:hypothetical protein